MSDKDQFTVEVPWLVRGLDGGIREVPLRRMEPDTGEWTFAPSVYVGPVEAAAAWARLHGFTFASSLGPVKPGSDGPTTRGLTLCPRCKNAFLYPVLSPDGTAWESDKCNACMGSWFHDPPKAYGDMNDAQREASRWRFEPPKGWVLRTMDKP